MASELAQPSRETTIATFVMADLAGYTALTEAHGDEFAADTAAEFCDGVRALLDAYGAEEMKAIGDALLLRVAHALDAVRLGARIAGDLGARDRALSVRVGMHTGPAVRRGGDWFGAAVNVASRVADLAGPCDVLLTAATRAACGSDLDGIELRARGTHPLRHVRDPVEIWAVVTDASAREVALVTDPVCQMALDPRAYDRRVMVEHAGKTLHFCSDGCAQAFLEHPQRFAGGRAAKV